MFKSTVNRWMLVLTSAHRLTFYNRLTINLIHLLFARETWISLINNKHHLTFINCLKKKLSLNLVDWKWQSMKPINRFIAHHRFAVEATLQANTKHKIPLLLGTCPAVGG